MAFFDLSFECGETSLSVRRFTIHEAVSALTVISVVARSPRPDLDLGAFVGKQASIRVSTGYRFAQSGARLWGGICTQMELVHAAEPIPGQEPLSTYTFRIMPRFWLMTARRNYRIFQHRTIPEIITTLLAEHRLGADFQIDKKRYPKLEYKVQYGESDFTFFCRLCEEAGLSFHFPEGEPSGDGAILSDALHMNKPRLGDPIHYVEDPNQAAEMEFMTEVHIAHEVRHGAFTIRDYDFRKPAYPLFGEASTMGGPEGGPPKPPQAAKPEGRYERYHYSPGAFLIELDKNEAKGDTPVADEKGVARYDQPFGHGRAERSLAGARRGRRAVTFGTNAIDLMPGSVIAMGGHPHPDLDPSKLLLVTELSLRGTAEGSWTMTGEAVFAEEPYRPAYQTPKPRVHGVESATVAGPPGSEVHTDEFGRVMVQFPWDREGRSDDNSSCWIRVSQGWAGTGFGMFSLPRIGQEVLVSFLTGDPDQPMIVGRVYNAVEPTPYRLPEEKTKSTYKSDSSVGGDGYNEVMFEDKKGEELLFERAEKDVRKLVKNDETITVVRDRVKLVNVSETDTTIQNRTEVTLLNREETVGGVRRTVIGQDRYQAILVDEVERSACDRLLLVEQTQDVVTIDKRRERDEADVHTKVVGDRRTKIDVDASLIVAVDRHEKVEGRYALAAGDDVHLIAHKQAVGEAPDVTVKGPGGFLRIDATGVTISGNLVKINAGGSPGEGPGSHPEEPEKPDLERVPMIVELEWSERRVRVGETVNALFVVRNFQGGEEATVTVYEYDQDGDPTKVDERKATVTVQDGIVEVPWSRSPEAAEGDLKEDLTAGEIRPLDYRFTVEAGGVRSAAPSDTLNLTNTLVIKAVDEDGAPVADGSTVVVTTFDGILEATTSGGEASFPDVLVGAVSIACYEAKGSKG